MLATAHSSEPVRIALIHATALAVDPIQAAFARHWPQARRMNLLDDSLSTDLAREGSLTESMIQRFMDLALYARASGCSGILFTCSAFGPAIEAAARASAIPTLKPNTAMFEQALATPVKGRPIKIGLVASFQPSIASMREELLDMARLHRMAIDLRTVFAAHAMDDLAQGRDEDHHRRVAQAAQQFDDCDVVMLAQFSMAAAAAQVHAAIGCRVLSSPDCAVLALQKRVAHA